MVDWTKPILWDGKPARVLATDLKGSSEPVVIAITNDVGEYTVRCDFDGYDSMARQRATNAPKRVEWWGNVYGHGMIALHETRKQADYNQLNRIALVRYVFEDKRLVEVEIVPLEDNR